MSVIRSLSTPISTAGSYVYVIPTWCTYIDVVVLGGGAGGFNGTFGNGSGGNAGLWSTATLKRGRDIPYSTTQITGVVGAGGASNNGSGGTTTATATGMTTVTGVGGSGGVGTTNIVGQAAGSTILNGVTYAGGAGQGSLNNAGFAPGGGGAAGGFASAGGVGGAGQVWFNAWMDEVPSNFFGMY